MSKRLLPLLFLVAFSLFAADEKPAAPADLKTPPADAVKAENGLVTKTLAKGIGEVKPTDENLVKIRYTVWKDEKTRFWIPARLAYGDDPSKPQGMLVFDIELISFQ